MIKNNGTIQHLELAAKAFMEGLHSTYGFPLYDSKLRKFKCKNNDCIKNFETSCIGCKDYKKETN